MSTVPIIGDNRRIGWILPLELYAPAAREVLFAAEKSVLNDPQVAANPDCKIWLLPDDLTIAILRHGRNAVCSVVIALGIKPLEAAAVLEEELRGHEVHVAEKPSKGEPYIVNCVYRCELAAQHEAKAMDSALIDIGHLWIGTLDEDVQCSRYLLDRGLSSGRVREAMMCLSPTDEVADSAWLVKATPCPICGERPMPEVRGSLMRLGHRCRTAKLYSSTLETGPAFHPRTLDLLIRHWNENVVRVFEYRKRRWV